MRTPSLDLLLDLLVEQPCDLAARQGGGGELGAER